MCVTVMRLHVSVDVCDGNIQSVNFLWLAVRKRYVTEVHLSRENVATGRHQIIPSLCCKQVASLHVAEAEQS